MVFLLTHTHTHLYIHVCVCVCACAFSVYIMIPILYGFCVQIAIFSFKIYMYINFSFYLHIHANILMDPHAYCHTSTPTWMYILLGNFLSFHFFNFIVYLFSLLTRHPVSRQFNGKQTRLAKSWDQHSHVIFVNRHSGVIRTRREADVTHNRDFSRSISWRIWRC